MPKSCINPSTAFRIMAMLSLCFAMSMALPSQSSAKPSNCYEACMGIETMSEKECVQQCEDFMAQQGMDGKVDWKCWYHLAMDCSPKHMELKTFIMAILDCIEDGFSESCMKRGFCDATRDCIHDICDCAQHEYSPRYCKKQFDEACKHWE